jgi:transcriptional regulator with XRE-family HTH domain
MEDLSHKAGIHVTFLGHIELGRKAPSINTLVRIARALRVLPTVLLRGVQ